MKKKIFLTALAVVMTTGTGTGFAQMMGSGQHMYGGQGTGHGQEMMEGTGQQQVNPQAPQQNYPYQMYPGMTGYGYGMGPGMMGQGYGGYGMGPGMMGGYGYGMGPGMMGYGQGMGSGMMGYGMGPGMMGGYGYGMGPGMMGYGHGMHPGMMGYGMGPGMMGGCGGGYPGATGESAEKYNKALNETQELRRKMHSLQFEYGEALRNPEISDEKKKEMAAELSEVHEKIRQKMHQ